MSDVSLTLSDTPLFENVTLGIDSGEKIGFIGPNGAGKSTFISLITGERKPDTGTIYRRNNLKIAYLPQMPSVPAETTVAGIIFSSADHKATLVRKYESLINNYGSAPHDELTALQEEIEKEDAWNLENKYHSFLSELGIKNLEQKASTLSGGELRKADLARVLASDADLLLLDEPTNHLDLETVEWLENWLKNGNHTYILVTHDRTFLDNSCTTILELENRGIRKYKGNWSTYLDLKAKRLEEQKKAEEKRLNILRRELEWAARGPKARTSKDKKRLSRITDLQESKSYDEQKMSEFSARGRRLGKKVLQLVNVEKSLGNKKILNSFSYVFRKEERIGIAGPNGAGKTTLLSIISGRLKPDSGRIDTGVNTKFAFLDQSPLAADSSLSIIDYIKKETELVVREDGSRIDSKLWLERFGFNQYQIRKKIKYLSGGERRRLQIVRMLLEEPNFLILDEPTNDLDLLTLGLLEQFLETYKGCLMVVSHDRTFLEHIVDYFFILDGSGSVKGFSGSWKEYRESVKETYDGGSREKSAETQKTKQISRTPKSGLTFKEKKEMEVLTTEIIELEEKIKELEDFFTRQYHEPQLLANAAKEHELLEKVLEEKNIRWEELAGRDE